MFENEPSFAWDVIDIQMAIKRYFYKMGRSEFAEAERELEFLRSIHREWSYNPLMRRCGPEAMAIIDDFLRWFDRTPSSDRSLNDFTIRRLLKDTF